MLKNRRRRMVLYYLANSPDGSASLGDLAEQLAAWENGIPLAGVDSRLRKRTYNTLQQHHLPKLDDAGLVDFDRRQGRVLLAADPRQLELFLTLLPRTKVSWIVWFLSLGTLFWIVLLTNWLGVHILHVWVPGTANLLFGASFVVLLTAHVYILYRVLHPRKTLK